MTPRSEEPGKGSIDDSRARHPGREDAGESGRLAPHGAEIVALDPFGQRLEQRLVADAHGGVAFGERVFDARRPRS